MQFFLVFFFVFKADFIEIMNIKLPTSNGLYLITYWIVCKFLLGCVCGSLNNYLINFNSNYKIIFKFNISWKFVSFKWQFSN